MQVAVGWSLSTRQFLSMLLVVLSTTKLSGLLHFITERRSCYVTLPWYQNFNMTTNRERPLKSEFTPFQTPSILLNFIN